MQADARLVWALERNLQRACTLHERYLESLKLERANLKVFAADKVDAIRMKREELSQAIAASNVERLEILSTLPNGTTERLSNLLDGHFSPADTRRLKPLVERLRALALEVQNESRELSQVVNFALNLVHGSLALLWSATQNVTRSYNSAGSIRENRTPNASRLEGVRKEA